MTRLLLFILLSWILCFPFKALSASSLFPFRESTESQAFKVKEKNKFILTEIQKKSLFLRGLDQDLIFKIKGKNNYILAKSKKRSKRERRSLKKSRSSYGSKRKLSRKDKGELRKNRKKLAQRKKRDLKKKLRRKKKLQASYYLKRLKDFYKEKNYLEVSKRAFRMIMSSKFRKYRSTIRYILGLALSKMDLKQAATVQFINIIRSEDESQKRLIKKSFKQLYLAAHSLEDDTLLNYALSKIVIEDFPKNHRDMLYFRMGEVYLERGRYEDGIRMFNLIRERSHFFYKASYLKALSYSFLKRNKSALKAFESLVSLRYSFPQNDFIKASAIIGKARVLYQAGKWDAAIRSYRDVPKDTEVWHDSLLEMSWALLRTSRFRSALGLLHSLHSAFYENFYAPEALLLRAIVYLYICKYDELEKTLSLHSRIYEPLQKDIFVYLKDNRDPLSYFRDAVKTIRDVKKGKIQSVKYSISPLLALKIYRSGRFRRHYKYIENLLKEKNKIEAMPRNWKRASIGKYVRKVLMRRIAKARKNAGREVRSIMKKVNLKIVDYLEQERLIRYEMTSSQVDLIKEKIGKNLNPKDDQIDIKSKRGFYVQNGYEYWPFQGEYWLDELGNYYYLGTSSCKVRNFAK